MQLPEVFTQRMNRELGAEFPEFVESLAQPIPVSVRLHPIKGAGLFTDAAQVPWHPQGRYLSQRPVFTLDPAFHGGAYYVQEASSMILWEALRQLVDFGKKWKVLDLCAAPGGKTTLLASAISADSFILANETILSRLPALRTNMEKWGNPNVFLSNHDPAEFSALQGFFDIVLVDAPCSGEGLFRKDEAAVKEWSPALLELCSARQQRILSHAVRLVSPGGLLVYSTCTFNPSENESVVEKILESGGFEVASLDLDAAWGIVEKNVGYQCYPHRVKGEGFYFACLRKMDVQDQFKPVKKEQPTLWRKMNTGETVELKDWVQNQNELVLYANPKHEIHAVPASLNEEFRQVAAMLKRRSHGVHIGTLKNGQFVPSHCLALSSLVCDRMPCIELDKHQALLFLKKERIELQGIPGGWHLVRFGGINLGWVKVLDQRINNYLPLDWRIKMDISAQQK